MFLVCRTARLLDWGDWLTFIGNWVCVSRPVYWCVCKYSLDLLVHCPYLNHSMYRYLISPCCGVATNVKVASTCDCLTNLRLSCCSTSQAVPATSCHRYFQLCLRPMMSTSRHGHFSLWLGLCIVWMIRYDTYRDTFDPIHDTHRRYVSDQIYDVTRHILSPHPSYIQTFMIIR